MEQPLEDRVAALEGSAQRHDQTIARLDAIIENHDELLERIQSNQEALQANQEALQANQETMQSNFQELKANQEAIVNLMEELTREATTTRRLWLRLAQRYGWLDDEQNGSQPDTPV